VNSHLFDVFSRGKYGLFIIGLITSVEIKTYADGQKERLVIHLFTGREYTDEIILWPDDTGKISEYHKSTIIPKSFGMAMIFPKQWNGRCNATLKAWKTLID
jgi:hypothetical protein